jgi:hypothetical protein
LHLLAVDEGAGLHAVRLVQRGQHVGLIRLGRLHGAVGDRGVGAAAAAAPPGPGEQARARGRRTYFPHTR